ncbi:MAG: serine hydrolase, partial [Nevskiales bacterium]
HDTGFIVDPATRSRRARVHARQADGSLLPIDHASGEELRFCMGGGRLCSTAPDYLRFLRTLLAGGSLDGARVLQPASVVEMGRNHIGDLTFSPLRSVDRARSNDFDPFPGMAAKWGLGFLINTEPAATGRSAGSLAWGGLANTYFWIDPHRRIAGLAMMQILPFADAEALLLFADFERAVYSALR